MNVVVPGPIDTNFRHFLSDGAKKGFEDFVIGQVPLDRAGTPEEAAAVALSSCRTIPPTSPGASMRSTAA